MAQQVSTLSLREKIAQGTLMKGSFVKMAGPSSVEIMGAVGFDFVVIDLEHGVFGNAATDTSLLAAKAAGIAAVIRVPSFEGDSIATALDAGATGILAPHISSVADANALVGKCRYRGGRRGFSGVTRAGNYGGNRMWEHIDAADAAIGVIAMIEDPEALLVIDEILAVEGLDAVFVGRGDLTVAFNAPSRDSTCVVNAVDRILAAAKQHGKAVWLMVESAEEAADFAAKGASSFIISSDQSVLYRNCAKISKEFDSLVSQD
ncbi:aldolase (plasmid) [Pseudorhodobacter turbinis]|uniref:Aldolase n=1 Tax=Pseudorhodobacter turbinis TaxID=2500533 RepID=A0A4P8EJL9_9RHOB|nr:aldolase/citrate lyase family protein [Pseudorhodobacter turbinis]QCO57381.1 aldolase [Pseudorhodobacter turbinis]